VGPRTERPLAAATRLREAREARGLSHRQIADATKLSVRVIRALEVTEWWPGPIGAAGIAPCGGRCAPFTVASAREMPVLPGCGIGMGVSAMRASMHRIAVSLMRKTKRRCEALLIRAWPASKTNVRKAHFVFRWPALDGSVFIATLVSELRLR